MGTRVGLDAMEKIKTSFPCRKLRNNGVGSRYQTTGEDTAD
jgi:hypothetical protein